MVDDKDQDILGAPLANITGKRSEEYSRANPLEFLLESREVLLYVCNERAPSVVVNVLFL